MRELLNVNNYKSILGEDTQNYEWFLIVQDYKLSEDFIEFLIIEDFMNGFNLDDICEHQTLSEIFLENHIDILNDFYISAYQKLSNEFISKHANSLDWEFLILYQNISEDTIIKNLDFIEDLNDIFNCQKLSNKFIEKYKKWDERDDKYFIKDIIYNLGNENAVIFNKRGKEDVFYFGWDKIGNEEKLKKYVSKNFKKDEKVILNAFDEKFCFGEKDIDGYLEDIGNTLDMDL